MRQKALLLSALLFIVLPWKAAAFRFLFPPVPEEEYIIYIDNGESDLVQTIVIVADNEPQTLEREWDNKFRYFGSQPDMIYIFPSDTNYGLTCQPWIKGRQEMVVSLIPKVKLKLKAHIIYAPEGIEEATRRVKYDCEIAMKIWQENYFGITIGELIIADDRKNSELLDIIKFNCSNGSERISKTSKSENEYVHIFYVKSVDGEECAGYSCNYPKPYCSLAYWRNPSLLAHELGHSFGLHHPELDPEASNRCRKDIAADQCNMMWDGCESPQRNFTLGQIIQSYMNSESTLNKKCSSYNADKNGISLTSADMECGEIPWIPSTSFGQLDTCRNERRNSDPDLTGISIQLTRYLLSDCATGNTLNRQQLIEYLQKDSNAAESLLRIAKETSVFIASTDSSDILVNSFESYFPARINTSLIHNEAGPSTDWNLIIHQRECVRQKAQSLAIEAGIL